MAVNRDYKKKLKNGMRIYSPNGERGQQVESGMWGNLSSGSVPSSVLPPTPPLTLPPQTPQYAAGNR